MYSLKDFCKGQTVWVELTGNASRYKTGDELIEEWEVISVGRKYVTAKHKDGYREEKFEETDRNYGGLTQKTKYCVDYVLYPTRQAIADKIEKENLIKWFKGEFSEWSDKSRYSLEKLRKAKEILLADET